MCPIQESAKRKETLNPPRLSSVIEDLDTIQPQTRHVDKALEKSRDYWYRLTSLAYAYRDHGLNPEYTNPRHILHRIPKLHVRPETTYARPYGVSPLVLCMQASSTWKLVGNSDCDSIAKK
ncbi:hypothetical protein DTO012A9_512 [Penicillium roqueforti]|nr:hypothetical protein CBS147354_35 [Penicillium roqueforti]KAI3241384.1 hypothetical protein CBS147310_731 [Penicillium roqueforti]KAI3271271.1 hypothetical protein DTO012A9_512 [Penicillium roqueforti]